MTAVGPDEDRLREDGDRIEQLLDELRGMAGPGAWSRVEELVQRLVELYGAGLLRLLDAAEGAGADREALAAALGRDELVASLLAVHDVHVVPLAERIERALEEIRPVLGAHAGGVELTGIDGDGAVRLRLLGACQGCPSSLATLELTVRRAIEAAAPEVDRIVVEGAASR